LRLFAHHRPIAAEHAANARAICFGYVVSQCAGYADDHSDGDQKCTHLATQRFDTNSH
jgi:hypothetical protein